MLFGQEQRMDFWNVMQRCEQFPFFKEQPPCIVLVVSGVTEIRCIRFKLSGMKSGKIKNSRKFGLIKKKIRNYLHCSAIFILNNVL